MTNIQAINLLKGLWQSLDDYCELNDEGKAAFCMAIEALSCSEIPNSSDTISREAAVDALDKRFDSIPMEQTTDILLLRKDLRELPSAQPATSCSEIPNGSDDTISRQAAIDAIMGQPPEPHYPTWYAAQIEKLPAVQPDHVVDIGKKVGWIPCSERLPERSIEVLTYTALVNLIEIQTLERDEHGFMYWENQHGDRQDLTVTAWMPLPEPYKGGDE